MVNPKRNRELNKLKKMKFSELQVLLINKQELKTLKKAIKFYDDNLLDCNFTYTYTDDDKNECTLKINFSKQNFQHLTGMGYYILKDGIPNQPISAVDFYSALQQDRLEITQVFKKIDGTTILKLRALNSLDELFKKGVRISGTGRYLSLQYDKAIRSGRKIVALTTLQKYGFSIPQSLINLKTDKGNSKSLSKSYEAISLTKETTESSSCITIF